jgi:diketogulonate reductase-like aldo/keto reductase
MPVVDCSEDLRKENATPSQIALAWLRRRSHGLFNPRDTQHRSPEENLGAIKIQLTPADLRRSTLLSLQSQCTVDV